VVQQIVTRLVAQRLSERLGQQFIVENRPGGGSNIGTEAAVNAPADGYTLLFVSFSQTINATLNENLNYNFIRDIEPVASVTREADVLVVHPSVPARTVPEFIAHAKANARNLNMGSVGIGTGVHMAGEMFKLMTGIKMTHVPYRGAAPALADLLGGQIQVMFPSVPASLEYIKTGRLRALAVTTAARVPMLPETPAIGEFVPGYEASFPTGVGAPRNTPASIIERLNREINSILASPGMKARLADLGSVPMSMTSAEFGKLIADDTEKWGKLIRANNIKAE
jgi:tripartite-type tricarboxylate transporter receptor subunit TctC